MDIDLFFKNLVSEYDLGELIGYSRVSGGLTHKMYKIVTSKGDYVIKLLNPNIILLDEIICNWRFASIHG